MSEFRSSTILPAAALMLLTLASVAWTAGWLPGSEWWPVRAGVLAGTLVFTGLAAAVWTAHARRTRRQFEQHVAALCQLAADTGPLASGCDRLPPLPRSHPWDSLACRIADALEKYRTRCEDLEHSRTALEIRCGRAAAEYEKIQGIFASLAEPILAIDDYDDIVLTNASAENLFDIADEKTETCALRQLVRCEKLVELLSAAAQRRIPGDRTEEIEIIDSNGDSRWFRVTATKLDRQNAEPCHPDLSAGSVVAVLRDIGDQKAMQKRNAEFVSSVSHEMKTPLAGIKAYVELLADGDAEDEETREEFLEVINSQADRLQRLVENLLNIARIEAGVVSVSKVHQSLNEVLEEALHVVLPAAEAKNIDLTAELSPLYLGVLADRDMLLQAAINLLSNAIKYTPEAGRVTLRSRLDDNDVRFEVQDTGVGLSEEDSHRIFEKFYRVKKDKQMASGTGLGLPLAKHIVEDVHRGHLTVQSKEGEGSTFTVVLPGAGQITTSNRGPKASASVE
ncbi:MAG: ATP-binding protein [Thermoguttaceae bacterium]|jgi:two-component system phosphate regulon sensor histidine kinase PhoR|nr:ATP-binding protein [Thermoguttaceae bacterium]